MLERILGRAPNRQPGKDRAVTPTAPTLHFLITHVFLPPGPPKFYDIGPSEHEQDFADKEKSDKEKFVKKREHEQRLREHLIQTVHDALTRFRTYFNATQATGLDRCIRMLRCMIDAREESGLLYADVLRRQMTDLKDNGIAFP